MQPKKPGDRIGPFRVRTVVTPGAQALSYVCADAHGGAVFVKEYELVRDRATKERFFREAETLARLGSTPYLPRYVTSDLQAERPWIAMEFVPGGSLSDHVAAHGPFTDDRAAELGTQLAQALHELHCLNPTNELVHRDVKPQNVMLTRDSCKLVDLGIIGGPGFAPMTTVGFQPGTPFFMSPEQMEGRELSGASDVYSLALTLLFAIGELRQDAFETEINLALGRSRPLIKLLHEVIAARRPEDRPSAAVFSERLTEVARPEVDEANKTTGRPRRRAPVKIDRASMMGAREVPLGWCITSGHCDECPGVAELSTGTTVYCSHGCHA